MGVYILLCTCTCSSRSTAVETPAPLARRSEASTSVSSYGHGRYSDSCASAGGSQIGRDDDDVRAAKQVGAAQTRTTVAATARA
jgi:hypothetical protein